GGLFALLRRALGRVAAEQPRRRELAELVPHHVLGDVHRDELVPVVHREGVAHELGDDGARPAPGFDDPFLVLRVEDLHFGEQRLLNERALLDAPCHYCVAFPRLRPRTMCLFESFFRLRVLTPSGLPQGDTGGRPPELLPSPPPSGWSTGFLATPRTLPRRPSQRVLPALPRESSSCSELPTSPMVARHLACTSRISVDLRRSVT